MGRYLIIDREEKAVEQIIESLKATDSQPQVEIFSDPAAFNLHVQTLTPDTIPTYWTFDLMIMDYSLYPHNAWAEKITMFKAQNTKEASFVLTGYENNFTAAKHIRPLDIYNFVFKPFDALILKESLNLALKIKKKASPLELKSQSATAFIALLKPIEIQAISELGFVTISDAQIEVGSVAKYFSTMFTHGKKQSAWAQCLISAPLPQKAGTFINKFQFFAPEHALLTTVRRYIAAHKSSQASSAIWNLTPPKTETHVNMAIIGIDSEENKNFAADLESRYTNLKVEVIKLDPQKKTGDQTSSYAHNVTINMTDIKHENFAPLFPKDCIHLWFPETPPKEDDLKTLAAEYRDIFLKPLDRSYFFKKLKTHIHALNEKDPNHLINVTTRETTKVANKVKISEISELYVNLVHNREIPFKEFRDFVFLVEDETQNVEIPAFCHYTEKSQGGGKDEPAGFLHQFVFFGMTDHLLKQIRLWLLHNYIISNQKSD